MDEPNPRLRTDEASAFSEARPWIQEGELKQKAVTDPREAVAGDVKSLRTIPALPGEWLISGLIYDVATGLVEIVVPPAAIRTVSIALDQDRSSGLSRVA
jgi:carbonic anhydrase